MSYCAGLFAGRRNNGANRARTSASSENFSSRTGKSSNGGEIDDRRSSLSQPQVALQHPFRGDVSYPIPASKTPLFPPLPTDQQLRLG